MNAALASYIGVLRGRWRWLVWGTLTSLAVAVIAICVQPHSYRSDARVFVRTPGDVSRVVDGGDFYAQARAKTYAALAGSPSVSAGVIADLGLAEQASALADRISASNPPGTALIDVSVSASSAAEARQIATAFLYEYGLKVRELESVPGSLVPRAELVVVDSPADGSAEVARGLSIPLVLLGATMIGLILGAVGAVLRYTFQGRDRRPAPGESAPAAKFGQEVMS